MQSQRRWKGASFVYPNARGIQTSHTQRDCNCRYSGADITNVCRDAAMMSMRRAIKGKKPDEIRAMSKADMELPTTMEDVMEALSRVQTSVGKEDLEKYKAWMEEYGAT